MIYIDNLNSVKNQIKIFNINSILDKMKSLNESNVDYFVLINDTSYCLMGIMTNKNQNCIIDLFNSNIETKEFYYWLSNILSNYDDYYCAPNKKGSLIWKAFGLKSSNLYITFSPLKIIETKFKFRFIKFLFINMFFKLSPNEGLFKINKKLFYKRHIPSKIILDTF